MSQQYVVVPRKNLQKPEEPSKFYALARSYRRVDTEELCKKVSQRSSYSTGELEGAIGEFLVEIQNVLSEGSIVRLGKLGNFRLVLQTGKPTAVPTDFNKSNVKGCKVNFRPSTQLLDLCKNVKFIPYHPDEVKEEEVTPEVK